MNCGSPTGESRQVSVDFWITDWLCVLGRSRTINLITQFGKCLPSTKFIQLNTCVVICAPNLFILNVLVMERRVHNIVPRNSTTDTPLSVVELAPRIATYVINFFYIGMLLYYNDLRYLIFNLDTLSAD